MKKQGSSNQYDKLFRENIESIFMPLIERSLGIIIASKKALPVKVVNTNIREMDSLYEIKTTNGQKLILHLEVQTKDDREMIYRVGEYHALILRKYQLPIRHIVIYLGQKPSRMRAVLSKEEVFTSFELLSFNEMDPDQLLQSDIPEEVILAILSNFKEEQSEMIIQRLLLRLQKVSKNKNQLKKYTSQLTILSKLRNLEEQTVKTIGDMTQLFDITTSILFQEGLVKGHKEGHVEGMDEGVDKGDQKRQLIIIANMITKSPLSIVQIADLAAAEESFVIEVKEKLETKIWTHPEIWTDEEWEAYFLEKKENDGIEED